LIALAAFMHAPGKPSLAFRALRHFRLIAIVTPSPPLPGDALPLGQPSLSPLGDGPAMLARRPGHPLLIDVFATWCPPCRDELAALALIAPRLERSGVDVAGIDQAESPVQVEAAVRAYGIRYPVYIDPGDDSSWVSTARVIPTTILLDGRGVVRFVHAGPLTGQQILAIARTT
jgi:thiol-disulfide isomerase/thioredoxin